MSAAAFRRLSTLGFLGGVVAASLLHLGLATGGWFGLPSWTSIVLGVAALFLHTWSLSRSDVRVEAGAYALAALAFVPAVSGAPQGLAWALAAASGVGFLLSAEAAFAGRRIAKLAAAEGFHVERVAGPLQRALVVPLVGVLVVVLLAQPLGRMLLGLPGPSLANSIEASGIYGAAFGAALLAGLLGLAAWVRHLKQAATE